jgi:hypothetical protein
MVTTQVYSEQRKLVGCSLRRLSWSICLCHRIHPRRTITPVEGAVNFGSGPLQGHYCRLFLDNPLDRFLVVEENAKREWGVGSGSGDREAHLFITPHSPLPTPQ